LAILTRGVWTVPYVGSPSVTSGRHEGASDTRDCAISAVFSVRRGGIEPPTRGFSVPSEIADLPERNADPSAPRGGSGAVSDPDEAVRRAIKVAIDAGCLELAARLLDVLREAPKPGGALVRLELVKRGRYRP
jgi:hypothetical protein